MVHRRFTAVEDNKNRKPHDYSRTLNPRAHDYLEDMAPVNGVVQLTEEQREEAQQRREDFRNEVSQRMGALLLRGVTMLDAYCQQCNGILMEDRNGQRTCVTCELYREKGAGGSRIIAQIPLDEEVDGPSSCPESDAARVGEVSHAPQFQGQAPRTEHSSVQRADHFNSLAASVNDVVRTYQPTARTQQDESITNGHVEVRKESRKRHVGSKPKPTTVTCTDASMESVAAVEQKLVWVSEKLNESKDLGEIQTLLSIINQGLGILKEYK